jgi:hypothetical protein
VGQPTDHFALEIRPLPRTADWMIGYVAVAWVLAGFSPPASRSAPRRQRTRRRASRLPTQRCRVGGHLTPACFGKGSVQARLRLRP